MYNSKRFLTGCSGTPCGVERYFLRIPDLKRYNSPKREKTTDIEEIKYISFKKIVIKIIRYIENIEMRHNSLKPGLKNMRKLNFLKLEIKKIVIRIAARIRFLKRKQILLNIQITEFSYLKTRLCSYTFPPVCAINKRFYFQSEALWKVRQRYDEFCSAYMVYTPISQNHVDTKPKQNNKYSEKKSN
ncbi:hypothetical protein CWI38_0043p0060 [Hamiltosporidium tvaerminnensis]|uniref:Uncharacterized protein n=1 Tax=Hamiltosporidium tvaerminnensis TaxID=1176355 RepID=A0A4Q9M4X6_9MICR|nr:hypothetical protein CWI38_0043p0060 [Hamiltosporidium tvaerminnensis]